MARFRRLHESVTNVIDMIVCRRDIVTARYMRTISHSLSGYMQLQTGRAADQNLETEHEAPWSTSPISSQGAR
jgi:hypothetical protein